MSAADQQIVPRGLTAEIADGRRLRYVLAGPDGSPRPLIVLEAGSFGFSADWAAVQCAVLGGQRACARSLMIAPVSASPTPAPCRATATPSSAIWKCCSPASTSPAPTSSPAVYLPMAGMHVRLFADRNAAQVRAIVLVDATTPEAIDLPSAAHFVGQFTNLSKLAAWGATVGIQRPLAGALGDAIGLPAVAKEEKRRAFADPVHNRWAAAEVEAWRADAAEARAAEPYDPSWPVAVVLTGDGRQPPWRGTRCRPRRPMPRATASSSTCRARTTPPCWANGTPATSCAPSSRSRPRHAGLEADQGLTQLRHLARFGACKADLGPIARSWPCVEARRRPVRCAMAFVTARRPHRARACRSTTRRGADRTHRLARFGA